MRGRGGNNRKGPNPLTRSYESTGPDVKVRGTALHIAEKYVALARDAQSSGDRVLAENYLQHAEHYYRIIAAAQAQLQQPIHIVRSDVQSDDEDFEDDVDTSADIRPTPVSALDAPQPYVEEAGRPAQPQPSGERPPYQPREGREQPRDMRDRDGRDRDGRDRDGRDRFGGDRRHDRQRHNGGGRPPYQDGRGERSGEGRGERGFGGYEPREGREPREAREGRDQREGREPREVREPREGREGREAREPRHERRPEAAPEARPESRFEPRVEVRPEERQPEPAAAAPSPVDELPAFITGAPREPEAPVRKRRAATTTRAPRARGRKAAGEEGAAEEPTVSTATED